MKKKIVALLLGATMVAAVFAGCGNKTAETEAPKEETKQEEASGLDTYMRGVTGVNVDLGVAVMEGATETYVVQLKDDGTYEYIVTQTANLYSADCSIATITYGTYKKGEAEDGYAKVTLNDAERVVYNANVPIGGISLVVDTDDESCFPAELLGSGVADQSAEDYLEKFGKGMTFYIGEGDNTLYTENPAEQL